jgi:hypothetical protein
MEVSSLGQTINPDVLFHLFRRVVETIVIKPGPVWRVNSGTGRPGGWTVRVRRKTGKYKKPAIPGRPGESTHDPGDPSKPGRDPMFVMHKLLFVKSKLDP